MYRRQHRHIAQALASAAAVGVALAAAPAGAGEPGESCCRDLDERVATLEAAAANKSGRQMGLTVSGFLSNTVIGWSDGHQSGVDIGDGAGNGSRFRFVGQSKITPEVRAGVRHELGIVPKPIKKINQKNRGRVDDEDIKVRHAAVWLEHDRLGKLVVGLTSTATDGVMTIDLSGCGRACTADIAVFAGGFMLRGSNGVLAASKYTNWKTAVAGAEGWDSDRRNTVLYETPTLAGFSLQAAVAEESFWDVALRYAGTYRDFRLAAGIGYLQDQAFEVDDRYEGCVAHCNTKMSEIKGAASVLHAPTGLFATVAMGLRNVNGGLPLPGALSVPDARFVHGMLGISRNLTGFGQTVLFGEFGRHWGGLAQSAFMQATTAADCDVTSPGNVHRHSCTGGSRATAWGIGVTQMFDAAALEVFLAYKHFSLDKASFAGANSALSNASDFGAVILGTRVSF